MASRSEKRAQNAAKLKAKKEAAKVAPPPTRLSGAA
jgi:hypothetical protein